MDIEQIKLVVDAVVKLGEQGKGAFIVWVVMDKLLPFIGWMAALGCVCKVALKLIERITNTGEEAMKVIRDSLRIGCRGHLTHSEAQQVIDRVRELINNQK